MRALLLKDWLVARKYCKVYLLFGALFIAGEAFGASLLTLFYPAFLSATLPVTLMSFEERCGWNAYAQTMPLSRRTSAVEKYVVALLSALAVFVLIAAARAASWLSGARAGSAWEEILWTPALVCCASLAVCSMMLPLAFRFGTERGRALFLLVAALLLGGGLFFQASAPGRMPTPAQAAALASAASLLLFCASCLLSVRIWENREF